jgi:hypothetical protein
MIQLTPLKTIRAFCLECAGRSPKEVRYCSSANCPLYFYRFGRNPSRKGVGPGRIILRQKSVIESAKISKERVLNDDLRNLSHR